MRATFAVVALLAAGAAAFFDGPCTDTECGAPGEAAINCEADGKVCVPFPVVSVEGRKGQLGEIELWPTLMSIAASAPWRGTY
ncbi:hypothetical protein LX36DRAFT_708209 [Colletotrichum falcatum]|nr:hypothetical protein LX36DRAFT_708209 [Colletotrichum falcatum]